MIELKITEDVINRAKVRLKDIPKLKNSITNNEATLHGLVGEELVAEYLHASVVGDYNYDLLKNGVRLEIKTKRTTVKPKEYYEVSIAEFNTKQNCHYYIFVRILNKFEKAWILGCMPKKVYMYKSRFLKKGSIDGDNGFVVKADCWNLRIDELIELSPDEFDET